MLHVSAKCVESPSFSHLLNLVPTEAPLTELRLHPSFANTPFLQPQWFSILQNLTVLIVNGRDMHEPFELFPTFTQLRIFEADHLCLPFYEPKTHLPILSTLRKLQLRACSIQWMAGRHFPFLEECAILIPRHWAKIQHHAVQLPSCEKLTYHGHPMTTAQYFDVPKMRAMELRSHDCMEQRVYQHLRHLCRVDGRISKLTTLRLTFQCSEQVLIKVLEYLVPLQEFVISIAYPSPSWQNFLESLVAKPSTKDWPVWHAWRFYDYGWEEWCSPQTWHANVLPHLKFLGVRCPNGFSQSECLENSPLLRLVGWSRAQLTPPLEHLKVWEGRGTTDDMVDYISTDYLDKHPGISGKNKKYDRMVVRGMVTQCLVILQDDNPILQLHSTVLFRQLEDLKIYFDHDAHFPSHELGVLIFPCLEQLKRLEFLNSDVPADPLKSDFPLMNTIQWLRMYRSAFPWMLGRTFKALRELVVQDSLYEVVELSRDEGPQVELPACTILSLEGYSMDLLRFLSCPNVQMFHFGEREPIITKAGLEHLIDFLRGCSRLQELKMRTCMLELERVDSLIQFVIGDAREQGVWRDIRSVEVTASSFGSWNNENRCFASIVGQQWRHEKWWKQFIVIENASGLVVTASM